MKKVRSISLLAMLFAVLAAFAFKSAPNTTIVYGVDSQVNDYFYIHEALTGQEQGVDFLCNEEPDEVCKIQSDTPPDMLGRIAKNEPTLVVLDQDVEFQDLNP